jgi:hypothetical protein
MDVGTQIATGVIAQINAARVGTFGVRVYEPAGQEPSTVRTFEGILPSGTDVENTDQLVDERSGNVYEVVSIIDTLWENLQPDLNLVLKRVTATTQSLCRKGLADGLSVEEYRVAHVIVSATAIGDIERASHDFLENTIGPLVTADAIRYAPKRTGALAASIRYWVSGVTLYVGAFENYSADVELGHRVWHRFKHQLGPEIVPEEPYLRPALYKYRTPEDPIPPALFPVGVQHPVRPFRMLSMSAWYEDRYGPHDRSRPLREPL